MSKIEEMLNVMVEENRGKIDSAITDALVYGMGGLTVSVDGTDSKVYFSNVQDRMIWSNLVSTTARSWEMEVDFGDN